MLQAYAQLAAHVCSGNCHCCHIGHSEVVFVVPPESEYADQLVWGALKERGGIVVQSSNEGSLRELGYF